jgi:hypothetical protein
MHTLQYVMGDTLFFATLKGFATDPNFTYDHQNVTDDVEQYFSKAYGKSLKPLFDFYLRTTNKLEVSVKARPRDKYLITLLNIGTELPVDVTTDTGTNRMTLTPKGIIVESKTAPVIDKDGWYLKKVILE